MATFAKIGLNGLVVEVQSLVNEVLHDSNGVEREDIGIEFLTKLTGWAIWKQSSYNMYGGVHKLGGIPFRKNHASVGFTYDETRDAFIPPKPYNSWILNEDTCLWEAPVAKPTTELESNQYFVWNESILNWDIKP